MATKAPEPIDANLAWIDDEIANADRFVSEAEFEPAVDEYCPSDYGLCDECDDNPHSPWCITGSTGRSLQRA